MKTLGKTQRGTTINLSSFLLSISKRSEQLLVFSEQFIKDRTDLQNLANQAGGEYTEAFSSLQIEGGMGSTLQASGFTMKESLITYRVAISILFGYSHYLKIAGFNINNPTDYSEITNKLYFAKESVFRAALILLMRYKMSNNIEWTFDRQKMIDIHRCGFIIGIALGHLTEEVHLNGKMGAMKLLNKYSGTSKS